MGDGDDDGLLEVYTASASGLWQHRAPGGWVNTLIDNSTGYFSVAVGDGDRDGEREIYVGSIDGDVHEYDP